MKRLSVLLGMIILSIFMVKPQLLAVEFQEIRNKFVRANKRIPDRYIVVLKDDAVLFESKGGEPESHLLAVQSITNELIRRHGGVQRHIYSSALKGFSVQMFESQALGLSQDPRVLFVEEAGQVSLAQTTQTNAPWGLDRSDQRDLPRNNTYIYTHNGTGVNVFVIDTGIRYSHQQFGGRAFPAFSVGGENNVDIIGHGTHVAGIIGGSTYGIAKNVRLHSVRVFRNDQQQWTTDDIIAGIDWVAQHHNDAQYGGPDVANLSFELPAADQDANSLDMAVQGLINAGVTCVVAAGNNNTEANMVSPARLPAAITVSATTSGDSRVINFNSQPNPNDCYYPTNYPVNANSGSVVDLFAPGREITSARWDNDTATCELTGTSMSTAFVSGVAAQYLQVNPGASPAQVQNAIVGSSTPFRLSNVPNGTPNQLLYSNLDNARFVMQTPPPAFMNPGQTASVSVKMKNIGTTTWTSANLYRLGSQNPDNNLHWGFGRVELPGSVVPNSEVTFNFTITAPSAPGVYNFQWRMLKEGELWFGDITPNIPVTVSTSQSPFLGTPIQIPGIIQIENFDNGGEGTAFHDAEPQNLGGQYRTTEGVDITGTADVGGGYIVGWTAPGEWLEYTVNVPTAGTYTLEARVAALNNGGSFRVEFNDSNITPGGISIPNTGGWDSWITVRKNISLSAGNNQIMRIEMDTGGYYGYVGNINHIRIAQYQGYFDAADCQYALGWAWDRGQPNTPISIDISKDGATPITFPADAFRQDLLNAGIGNGYHGFFFPVPSSWKDGIPHSISVKYSGTTDHLIGSPRTLTCASSGMPVNVALATNGGVATASSTINSNYPAAAANNGDRKGLNWGAGGGWNDATAGVYPDWIQVDFNGTKTINEIDVFTLQDNFSNPVEPTPTLTFNYYGITAFNVQYWNGSGWVTIPGGTVTGNNLVWRKFTFSNIATSKIRVTINNALNSHSRVVELEAYSPINVARSTNGGVVTASSTINSNYPTSAANNGDRKGLNWGAGGGWNDATSGVFPDWIQVDFNGTKTINEIDVFTLQDNFSNPVEPIPTMTFSLYGITAFNVQYWNGSAWITIPGGSITGNNMVWRRFTFSNIATSKIRVVINNALNSYSRIVELEAYSQ